MNNNVVLLLGIVLLFGVIIYFALQKNQVEVQAEQKQPAVPPEPTRQPAPEATAPAVSTEPASSEPASVLERLPGQEDDTEETAPVSDVLAGASDDPNNPSPTLQIKRPGRSTTQPPAPGNSRPRVEAMHFAVEFPGGTSIPGIIIPVKSNPQQICDELKLPIPRPALFISGGAGNMSEEDINLIRDIITHGVARFAQEHNVVVIDGGTESGVMKMIGDARLDHQYTFPLVGCAPLSKVAYPGHDNPHKEADLENGHSHFVLVLGKDWGDESETIVQLTHTVSGQGQFKTLGIVINGGKITRQDVYLATTRSLSIPLMVLEGSGRFADELATAFKTGDTEEDIVRAIVQRADIQVLGTTDGPDGVYQALKTHFGF